MNVDEERELTQMKGLKDMEKGVLLEIGVINTKTREYGEYGLVCYVMTL